MLNLLRYITKFSTLFYSILFLVSTSENTNAETKKIVLEHYSISQGLSNSVVNDIQQDQYGFIWLATDDGLNRFDGYNFKIYRKTGSEEGSISSSFIKTVFCDSKGRLWVGTISGLNLYNSECDCFKKFLPELNINSISEDKHGNIIIATDGGLRIIEGLETEIIIYNVGNGLPENGVRELYQDRKDNMLCITQAHLFTYSHASKSIKMLFERDQDETMVGVSFDIQGFLWLCTTTSLIKLDPDNNYQVMNSLPFGAKVVKSERSIQFLIDRDNEFWIGSNGQLIKYNPNDKKFDEIDIVENNIVIEKTQTQELYEDKMGNIWISLYGNGVFVKVKDKNSFNHIHKVPFNDNSLSNNIVSAFAEDDKNRIWIGTWGGGLNIYSPSNNDIKRYKFKEESLNKEIFRSLLFVPPSTLWAVSSYNGLVKLDIQTNSYFHFNEESTKNNLLANSLRCIIKDSRGNVILASGDGILEYDSENNQFNIVKSFSYSSRGADSLRFARALYEDKYGNLWVGTHGLGLYKLNMKESKFTQYKSVLNFSGNQINHNIIYALKEDKRGLLWIGTMGGGINIYNPSNEMFYHLTEVNGLPNNIVNGILEDGKNLWISTNDGLCQFEIPGFIYSDTLTTDYFDSYDFTSNFYYYDHSDGIQSKEFKYAAAFKSSTDQMYFGGVNGMNTFDPKEIKVNASPPIIHITDFYIHGKRQLAANEDSPLDSSIFIKNVLHLYHDQNFFTLDFVAINYNNPGKNRYKYILRNFDKKWIETKNRSVSYMNLNPGEYIFELTASNNDGVWSEDSKKLRIIIEPPLWGRLWFQALFVFSLIGLLFAFYRYRLYKVKQSNILLEKKIEKRTHQLRESNLRLESQKEEILEMSDKLHRSDQVKLRFFTNISHDFRTPLTLILGPLEKLLSGSQVTDYTRNQLSYVYKNALKLLKLINELLDFRKLDTGNLNVKVQETDIIKFTRYICSFYEQHAKNRNISLKTISDEPELILWVDTDLMEKVFSNLLSNAFKYTKDGGNITIHINAAKTNSGVTQISFEDDGKGISEEQINLIFNRFYQVEKSTDKNQQYGSGIGLALCKEYIELHKGSISVFQREQGGTKFVIELKNGFAHFEEQQIAKDAQINDDHGFNLAYAYEYIENPKNIEDQPENQEKPTILVVDDNTDIQCYIMDILSDEYRVLVASNNEEGMKKAIENIPDLILLDIMMPGINGLNLGKKLKEDKHTNHIPIIILSARASEEEKLEGFLAGADDYIIKPFSAKVLKSRIKSRIRNRRKLINKFKDHIGFNPNNVERNSPDEEFLKKLIKILDKNLSNEDFNTEILSSEMNLSRTQLYRKISAITEQSASEFIRSYKMRKAAELLAGGKYNVSEVAYQLGYKTLPHFTRTFTFVFKETPSKFISKRN